MEKEKMTVTAFSHPSQLVVTLCPGLKGEKNRSESLWSLLRECVGISVGSKSFRGPQEETPWLGQGEQANFTQEAPGISLSVLNIM